MDTTAFAEKVATIALERTLVTVMQKLRNLEKWMEKKQPMNKTVKTLKGK